MTGGDYRGPDSFSVGSEVAGYRLEEQIGRGGMAVVFRARDVQLGRNVALKLLAPVLALDDAFRQRFIRESRAAAAVDHPHIIPIFAAGESDGVLFIAMRYVQGGDVRTLLDNAGALPAGRGADIITQVALALDAAHLHGLVHRDIKPANMLLDSVSDGAHRDHVYLADFGLSKRSLSVTGLTSIGQFLGTPAYVAPEQVEGRPVDGRADLYALACASFEILSGAPPYERDDDLAVMWAHVAAPPPSLSARRPDLPAEIDGVLARAMAKAPADRYPTCLDFAVALRRALGLQVEPPDLVPPAGGPGPSEPPGPPRPGAHPPTEISMPRGRPDARPDRGAAAAPYGAPPGTAGPAPEHFGRPESHGPPPAKRSEPRPSPSEPAAAPYEPAGTPYESAGPSYDEPAGPPYDEPAGPAYDESAGPAYEESAGPAYDESAGPPYESAGPAYDEPAGPANEPAGRPYESAGPSYESAGPAYDEPAGPAYDEPAGPSYDEPAGRPHESARPPYEAAGAPYEPPTEQGWLPPLRPIERPQAGPGASAGGSGSRREPEYRGTPPARPPGAGSSRKRSLWWPRGAIVVGCAAVAGIAIGAVVGLHGSGQNTRAANASARPAAALPILPVPGCSTAVPPAQTLSGARSAQVQVGNQPFGVVTTADGKFTFVTLQNQVAVLSHGSSLAPTLDYVLPAPGATGSEQLTNSGKFLLVAVNSGALVLDVANAEEGVSPIVGTLTSPFGSGAVEVAVSPDDKFAFVTLEGSANLVVFNLQRALADGFTPSDVVGKVPLNQQPIGMAISPDHKWLYATSRMRTSTANPSEGTLTVISLARAETTPSSSVVSTAAAGCGPARVVASPDGRFVWVTSRESDMLLGFSASALVSNPSHSLVARVSTGAAPIGLALANGGSRILVANSNIYNQHVTSGVAVISTSAALSGGHALLGQVSTGSIPREISLEPDGKTALVTSNGSGQLQAIDLSTVP